MREDVIVGLLKIYGCARPENGLSPKALRDSLTLCMKGREWIPWREVEKALYVKIMEILERSRCCADCSAGEGNKEMEEMIDTALTCIYDRRRLDWPLSK